MHLVGDLGHRGVLRHVLGKPRDGGLHRALGMALGQGQRSGFEFSQGEQGQLDQRALKTQSADGGGLVKIRV